jgi:acetyl-CoA acetyltransferase
VTANDFPARDRVAVVGVGTTRLSRGELTQSRLSLAAEAARKAIRDSGLDKRDIDGLAGTPVPAWELQPALGIPMSRWWSNPPLPASFAFLEAANAIAAGMCSTVLVYHSTIVTPRMSRAANNEPFRVRADEVARAPVPGFDRIGQILGYGYAAWAERYLEHYGSTRAVFGQIAVNARNNARSNPRAVARDGLSMESYLAAPLVRSPLSKFDMEIPVDGAEAFVLTTTERGRDCPNDPVLLHAYSYGQGAQPQDDQMAMLTSDGASIAAADLWKRSAVGRNDVGLLCLYDGFSTITVRWLEALGFCADGEAEEYLASSWDNDHALVNGTIPLNPHGGSLAEGGTKGTGHLREAITKLRASGSSPSAALVTVGGMFINATAMILRSDS